MPEEEHIEILLAGTEAWNDWRQQHPEIKPDLSGARLNNSSFSKADFRDTDLSDADLSDSILIDANFTRANLLSADLGRADLSHATFTDAHLDEAILTNANLNNATLNNASLRGADLMSAELRSADLNSADLINADIIAANLSKADLSDAKLAGSDLSKANLSNARLREANIRRANLNGAKLTDANLSNADLSDVSLRSANLTGADLSRANLTGAILNNADLIDANLSGAILSNSDLSGANLSFATIGWTTFGNNDLRNTKGLDTVNHWGPSTIGVDTIYQSRGEIPEIFLRGAGLPDNFITYVHPLTGQAIEFYSCFISHSSKDKGFCERLYADLQANNVRTWYFPEDAKWGESVWGEIDRSIKIYDRLVVVCSRNSLQSGPVLREIERALNREDRERKNILFPIRIDDYLFDLWEHERKDDLLRKVIGDFRGWNRSAAKYNGAFRKLLEGLKAEDKEQGGTPHRT